MNNQKLEEVLHDLNTVGYYKSNIVNLLEQDKIDTYNEISDFFEKMIEDPTIQYRLQTISEGLNIVNKDKYYEITHYEYLKRALNLKDGGLFKLYLDDFFVELAKRFLEVDNPQLYNVLFFIHGQGLKERSGSQRWHRDLEDTKILKIFMYCTEVDEQTGALEYVPKSFCGGNFPFNVGRSTMQDYQKNRILNSEEEKYCDEQAVTFIGKPGDIIICNNTGYHRGGYIQEGFRCMTHGLYVRPDAIYKPPTVNYDYQVNYIDLNSFEYKNLGDKQKHLLL